jgi:class 3 adenylate cyclase
MARGSAHADIAASVDRTLKDEARRSELMLAGVRTVALVPVVFLNTFLYFFPAQAGFAHGNLWLITLPTAWVLASAGFTLALRRGFYRDWMRIVIPLVDAALILATNANSFRLSLDGDAAGQRGELVVWSISAALLAASGGLRLTRKAALFTTGLAFLDYLLMALTTTHAAWSIYGFAMLASVGALSMWMVGIVRRAIRSEISKVTLGRFLPESVIEAAGENPLSLLHEPRSIDATVLVTDLRGFTTLAETISPSEAFALLNEVQGAFARAVQKHGGTVDKFLGDGMLAVFGAPEPLEDHASRAVEATIEIRRVISDVNARRAKANDAEPLKIGVAVHSGAVVAGCIGSGARLEFTIIGDTVNTASRLEGATKEKGTDVLISGETARRIEEQAGTQETGILEPLGDIPIRGRKEPLAVFGLLAK